MATVRYTVLDGEVIAEKRSGVRREYVPEPLGSTAALLDNTQSATDSFSYWPYGEEQARTGTTSTPFRYVGTLGYYRDSTNRQYVRARYLNTSQGRWMTEDEAEADWNLFVYANASPLSWVDLDGLQATKPRKPRKPRKPKPKPKPKTCPPGYSKIPVTCYGDDAGGAGHIGNPQACGCGGKDRPPQQGDCAIDQNNPVCSPGSPITIVEPGTGKVIAKCRACDTGQGHKGVDVFVPGSDEGCANRSGIGGTYCVKCS